MLLELRGLEDGAAVYAAELRDASGVWRGEATVARVDGAVAFAHLDPSDPPPPSFLLEDARGFLRTAWRAVSGEVGAPWPRRIHRWRAPRGT